MPVNNLIQFRRGSDWSVNPVLATGEPAFDYGSNILKVGDGTQWSGILPIGSISGALANVYSDLNLNQYNITGVGGINIDGDVSAGSGNFTALSINAGNGGFVFPTGDGSNGQVLKTDGNGSVTWGTDNITTGGSTLSIYSTGVQVGDSDIETLDFSDNFTIVESPDQKINISITNSSNWDTAYGWGDHSVAGYTSIAKRYSVTSTSNTFSSFTTAETYASGQIDIFQNGIKLHDGTDFTATNGSSVTLSNYAPSGSVIEYIIGMSSGIFTPLEISGLQLWLDANDSSTITLNGSTVSQWNDKSGNGYNVSQSTASNQPTYQSAVLNSKSVVRFDGSGDVLTNTTDTPVGGSTNRTVFVVFNSNTGITAKYPLALGNSTSTGQTFGISQEIGVRVNSGYQIWTTSVDSTHAIVTIILDGTSTTDLSAWKNGSSLSAYTPSAQTINTTSGILVGNGPSGGNLNGDVAEIIVYNSALSTSDRESVESYLSTKWGTAVAQAASDEYTNSLLLYPLDSDANDASSTGNNLTLTNASIDTSVKKYGAGSLKFTGSLSNSKAQGVMPSLGTNDFTIEFWLYMASMSNGQYILDRGQGSNAFYDNPGFAFLTTTSSRFFWTIKDSYDSEEGGYGASVGLVSSSLSSAVGSWVHVALVRQGTTYRMYIDGTQEASGTGSATDFAQHNFAIGDAMVNGGGVAQNSYIDDFRLSNTAVYPDGTTFTVPSAAHPTS